MNVTCQERLSQQVGRLRGKWKGLTHELSEDQGMGWPRAYEFKVLTIANEAQTLVKKLGLDF